MRNPKKRLVPLLMAGLMVLTSLTGCMGGPRKPSSPAPAAVTVEGQMRSLFIHATGADLLIDSPYNEGEVAEKLDAIMDYAKENGVNTIFIDVHDAKGSALYSSDYMPTSELLLDDKGKSTGGDIVYEAVKAGKKADIQVYAVINTTYIAEGLAIASPDHPAVRDSALSFEDENGILRWNTSKKDAMSAIENIARELGYNYGIAGIILNDDGTSPETLAKVAAAVDSQLAGLETGKKLGIYSHISREDIEAGTSPALSAFGLEGYSPDLLLADLQATTVNGDYRWCLDSLASMLGDTGLITVHNLNLISSDSGADGKLYVDPYEPAYQLYENRTFATGGTAIEGFDALKNSKYSLGSLMNALYSSDYDIAPYDLEMESGFGCTLPESTLTTNTAKYFISVLSNPEQPLYLNGTEVQRTTQNGLYGELVTLEYGLNEFVFTQGGEEEVVIRITRPQPTTGTADGSISRITQASMYPSTVSAARVGSQITVRCVAPSGSTVYANVLGKQIQLTQAVATSKNGIAATYTADLIFDTDIASNQVKNIGSITYTLVWDGNTTTYTSTGELYAVGSDAQLVMEVTDYIAGVTVDDAAANEGNFITTLIQGTTDYVELEKESSTHFFLRSGGAIRKDAVTLLEGRDNSILKAIEPAYTVKVSKGDEFYIPGGAGTIWHANFAENQLDLELFNIEDGALPNATGSKFTMASEMTDKGTVKVTITPNEGIAFWGYDVRFDGEELVFYCKEKPALSSTYGKPLEGISIVLDPGHGGYDPGALGVAYGYGPVEDQLNMAYALTTESLLEQLGANVSLTLYPDEYTDEKLVLFERLKIAQEQDADLFISMHHNSVGATSDSNKTTGLEVYYFTDASQALADYIAQNICASTGRTNRGTQQSYYVVTKMTQCPAVLTEIGYIVNPNEYEDLIDSEVIYRTAASFVKSIFDVLA